MITRRKFSGLILLATILGVAGFLPSGPAAQRNTTATGIPSLKAAPVAQASTYPSHVLIIRHAEKPDDKKDKHLTSRGAARAAALPSLFYIPKVFRTKPAPFPTPDFLFATAESKDSNRPVETVQPLAKALGGLEIHGKHADGDYQPLVDHLFSNAKHAGKTVLICWHHGKIRGLTRAVLAKAKNGDPVSKQVKAWDPAVFDRVWQITFDDQGQATFVNRPQRLLFKDHEE
jgi:hypothetical protein